MKKNPNQQLLHDVLRETSESFRQELFEASLKELRQSRGHTKTWLRLPLAIAAGLVLSAGLLFFGLPDRTKTGDRALLPPNDHTASASAYAPMEIVTSAGPPIAIVESRQYKSLIVQNSSIWEPVEILGDTELLALFPDRPAGLIANSQGSVQLVFLDSADQILQQ